MILLAQNSMKVLELVKNDLEKTFSKNIRQYCYFASDLSRFKVIVL